MAHQMDNTHQPVEGRAPLILGGHDFKSLTEAVVLPMERKTPLGWWLCFIPALGMLSLLGVAVGWLFWEGIGV
jgi:molybdopterin-containing oxidoreductase family membrane subunit